MPRRISAEEAKRLGAVPVEAEPRRKISAEEAKALGATEVTPEPSLMDKLKTEGGAFVDTLKGNTKALTDNAVWGVLPRVMAMGDAASETLNGRGGLSSNYDRALTDRQADTAANDAKHPSAAIVGSYLSPQLPGSTVAQRLVSAGGSGALAANLKAPHNDPGRLGSTIAGGLSGVAMQGANEAMGPLAARFSGGLRNYSGQQAANVAGGGKGQINDRMAKLGFDPEEHADFGNSLLDEGLIPTGLHPTESPVAGVMKRSRALKGQQGRAIGEEIQSADVNGTLDPVRAQDAMRQSVNARLPLELANNTKASKLIEQVGELTPQGEYAEGGGFVDANKTKSQAWDAANFNDSAPMEAKQYRKAVAGLRDSIRDQVGDVNGPESASRLTDANRRFGIAADAEALSSNAVSRGGQSQQFGLPAALMMAAGAGVGAATGSATAAGAAPAALIGSALLKSRGPAVAARLGRVGSDVANSVANMSQNPSGAGSAGAALERYFSGMSEEEKRQALMKLTKDGGQ